MRDEDHGPVAAPLAADCCEDPLGEVRRQRGGDLVEHQYVGLDRHGAGQVDDPKRRERHAPRDAREVQILDAQLVQPVAERLDRRLRQPQVGADIEIGDQRRFLVDRHNAAPARLSRRMDGALSPAHRDRAAVRSDGASEDLQEGALAGAVRTHQGVDLARPHGQRRRPEGNDGAVGLRDPGRLEQEVSGGEGHPLLVPIKLGDAGGTGIPL